MFFRHSIPRSFSLRHSELPLGSLGAEKCRFQLITWPICFVGKDYTLFNIATPVLVGGYFREQKNKMFEPGAYGFM